MRTSRLIIRVGPLLAGAVFLFAGAYKFVDPESLRPILEFASFPPATVTPLAIALGSFEAVVGGALLANKDNTGLIAKGALLLLLVYSIAIVILLAKGAPSCGCLGKLVQFQDARTANLVALARNALLVVLLVPGGAIARALAAP